MTGLFRKASGFSQYMVVQKMLVFTWNVWTSEHALRAASVLLQGTTASSLPPVQKKISGTDSHCEGNVAASVRNVSGSSAEGHKTAWKWLHVYAGIVPAPPWGAVFQHTQG